MRKEPLLYAALVASGMAGLAYEVVWSRYLGLYVGHSAFAQILVLSVYLGGMAVGALAVSDVSRRLRRPLAWYAATEAALALTGLLFHPAFRSVTDFTYETVFPALAGAPLVGAVRWGVSGLLILPQAILLGATFPLVTAGLVRRDAGRPGQGVAGAYLANTLGGAVGVLLAGFWLIAWVGLPGTVLVAAALNGVAASVAWVAGRDAFADPIPEREEAAGETPGTGIGAPPGGVRTLLLVVSFGTAVASFAYEIGWIRMLSLVLGSATHAFELMLSAFILGLALGSWLVRSRVDASRAPLRLLAIVQIAMGLAALATLPLYVDSFDVMAGLVRSLPRQPGGYALFNASRYGLCLAVMLPSTILAGMTLPLITGTLLRSGHGEALIGRVYGVNTIGSVVGAAAAGLFGLPWLGLEGLLVAGAAVDVLLGVWVLERWARGGRLGRSRVAAIGLAAVGLLAAVSFGVRLDRSRLTSGVFRYGEIPSEGAWQSLYYADGRTATVSAHLGIEEGIIFLSTNGKPDASVGLRWRAEGRDTLPPTPIPERRDFTTQVLAPAVALAHAPDGRSVANIGHGSGMTGTTLLTNPAVERLVTIEIEPAMVEGSLVFLPLNRRVFADPRSTFVFDDARSYFSYRGERFDIVFAEPSNPWVSGTSGLFTVEFYRRARRYLSERGIFAQWMQLYELDDDLLLSVLAALDEVFPEYRAFQVGDRDIVVIAAREGPLPDPDWSVLDLPDFQALTRGAPPFRPEHLTALELFDQEAVRPLLGGAVPANSDYHPRLDLGAERARFEQRIAEGTYAFVSSRLDLGRILRGERRDPLPYALVPARGLEAAQRWGRAAWLRETLAAGGGIAPEAYPGWTDPLLGLRTFLVEARGNRPPPSWEAWAGAFVQAESELHWGTVGWADAGFYRTVEGFLDRQNAPAPARAAVSLLHGAATLDWEEAAGGADQLVRLVADGGSWVPPRLLLDASVLAYLNTGRPAAARNALTLLVPRTGRKPWDLRNRLLEALVLDAEEAG